MGRRRQDLDAVFNCDAQIHVILTYLLCGLRSQANYTDRATAACRRS
jgi:hypothetical protein